MPADGLKAKTRTGIAGRSSGAVNERLMCGLWRAQCWGRDLTIVDGQSLQVVYAGRHTFDHGPDFRDALLVFGNDLVRGDVELHVRSGDWRGHGHQSDIAYDKVVLHVVWRDVGGEAITSKGRRLPVLALEEVVAGRLDSSILSLVGEDLVTQRMPCFLGNGARPAAELLERLSDLGGVRLAEKAAVFEATLSVEEPAQTLYSALLDALGYASNRASCRELAALVPWRVVAAVGCGLALATRRTELEALFMGAAGLLLGQRAVARPLDQPDAVYAAGLEGRWSALRNFWSLTPLTRQSWRFARVRPENFPTRRLAAAAYLLAPYVDADLPGAFLGIVQSEEPADLPRALEEALSVPAMGYWATHHDFGGKPALPTQLLGRARAADIAVNVILPFALAVGEARGDGFLASRARAALAEYPALAENELTRYVARLAFGRNRPHGILAYQQQGLLHVYHHYCRDKRCPDCPLAAA